MARQPRQSQYVRSDLILQIEKDLQGVVRLGQMQEQLIRQVRLNLQQLQTDSPPVASSRNS